MNLPNRLTILRVCLIPFFVVAMLCPWVPYANYVAAALFLAACFTDFLDGYIARKKNLITVFGKFMDPLADKLLVAAAMICFLVGENREMPAWAVIIIISREFIISGFRLVAAEKGVTIAASYWGKVKTVVQMVMSVLLILNLRHPLFRVVDRVFIYAAVLLTVISLVDYIYRNKDIMKEVR